MGPLWCSDHHWVCHVAGQGFEARILQREVEPGGLGLPTLRDGSVWRLLCVVWVVCIVHTVDRHGRPHREDHISVAFLRVLGASFSCRGISMSLLRERTKLEVARLIPPDPDSSPLWAPLQEDVCINFDTDAEVGMEDPLHSHCRLQPWTHKPCDCVGVPGVHTERVSNLRCAWEHCNVCGSTLTMKTCLSVLAVAAATLALPASYIQVNEATLWSSFKATYNKQRQWLGRVREVRGVHAQPAARVGAGEAEPGGAVWHERVLRPDGGGVQGDAPQHAGVRAGTGPILQVRVGRRGACHTTPIDWCTKGAVTHVKGDENTTTSAWCPPGGWSDDWPANGRVDDDDDEARCMGGVLPRRLAAVPRPARPDPGLGPEGGHPAAAPPLVSGATHEATHEALVAPLPCPLHAALGACDTGSNEALTPLGCKVRDVSGGGDCQYRAIAAAMYDGDAQGHTVLRGLVAEHILAKWDVFLDFVRDAARPGYCEEVKRPGCWGDAVSARAVVDVLGRRVFVLEFHEGLSVTRVRPSPVASDTTAACAVRPTLPARGHAESDDRLGVALDDLLRRPTGPVGVGAALLRGATAARRGRRRRCCHGVARHPRQPPAPGERLAVPGRGLALLPGRRLVECGDGAAGASGDGGPGTEAAVGVPTDDAGVGRPSAPPSRGHVQPPARRPRTRRGSL